MLFDAEMLPQLSSVAGSEFMSNRSRGKARPRQSQTTRVLLLRTDSSTLV